MDSPELAASPPPGLVGTPPEGPAPEEVGTTVIRGEFFELQWVTIVSAVTALIAGGGGFTNDLVEGGRAMLSWLEEDEVAEASPKKFRS